MQEDALQDPLQAAGNVVQWSLAWRWRRFHKRTIDDSRCERIRGRARLTLAVGNPALGQIVWSHLNAYFVTGQNTNVVFAHLP